MAIFKQIGVKSNKLSKVEVVGKKPIEILADSFLPTIDTNIDKKQYKQNEMIYFISGEIQTGEDGTYKRSNESLKFRDLIIIDIEDTKVTTQEAIESVTGALEGFIYYLYSTISHRDDNPRLRLILEPNKNILKDEYEPTIKAVMKLVGLNYDYSSKTWAQLQGGPIAVRGIKPVSIKHLEGTPFPVQEAVKKEVVKDKKEHHPSEDEYPNTLMNDDFYQIFIEYIKVDYNNLYNNEATYDRCLSVLLALARAVCEKEISYDIALECSELLANNDPNFKNEYINDNLAKINHAIKSYGDNNRYFLDNPKSYTFWQKVKATKDKNLINLVRYKLNSEIISNSELYYRLNIIGQQWREEHTTVNEKTGVEKVPLMQHYTIANKIIKLLPCKYGGYDEQTALLYFYDFDKGIYTPNEDVLKKAIIKLEYRYKLDNVKAIVEGLKTKLNFERPVRNPNTIAVGNGIFNLDDKSLEPFSPKYFITAKVDTHYNFKALQNYEATKVKFFNLDNWFNEIACNDSEVVELLWQLINEAVNPNKTRRKIAIMYGGGKNGKSTFQSFIVNLIGANNVSSITPHEIQQRFGVGGLEGKICNYADEIGTKPLDEVDKIKSIASGEVIAYERKNKDVRYYDFKTLLMFNSNQLPAIKEKSDAVLERLLIVPFNADFKGKEDTSIKDNKLNNKIILEYALYKALHLDFESFTIPKVVKDVVEEYRKDNDSIHAYFLDYVDRNLHHISRIPTNILKVDYEQFCHDNGYNSLKRPVKKVEERLNKIFKNNDYYYVTKKAKYNLAHLEELKRFDMLGKHLVDMLHVGDSRLSLMQEIKSK
ncbi:DNA primase family protein [Gemella cuniculi]|uniref:DNA primase family protein n=1 Tax=Gemella cuniculi TaxID=150240 RepID=UPI0003F5C178|nr:DNA primase family protein [Gemella cuniculi]